MYPQAGHLKLLLLLFSFCEWYISIKNLQVNSTSTSFKKNK